MSTKYSLKAIICTLCIFASSMLNAATREHLKNTQDFAGYASTAKNAKMPRKYYTFNYPSPTQGGNTLLTGIRRTKDDPKKVYISGFYTCSNGTCVVPFVYKGSLSGKGKWYVLNYPSSPGKTVTSTNLYGPSNGLKSNIRVVGNYTTVEAGSSDIGCLYEGPLNGSGKWTTLIPTSSKPVLSTIAHSTMRGLVVGNYSTQTKMSKAFIYDIKHRKYVHIIKPGAKSITAYGIWYNGGSSYTICGGYSNANISSGVGSAYLVDWDKKNRKFSNWRNYNYNNDPIKAIVTHFDGITSDGQGGYYLTGDWLGVGNGPELGFFCHVKRQKAQWAPISFPGQLVTSGNSVYKKVVIGVYTSPRDHSDNGYISIPSTPGRH